MRCHLRWAVLLVLVLGSATVFAGQAPPAVPSQPESPYVGAAACKDCHAAIYEKWSHTGHERAFNRVGADDQKKVECLECHVTGTPEQMAQELDKPSFPGVQCEKCHGPGRQHATLAATNPPATAGLVRKPGEPLCLRCHNQKSPHFRGFVFSAMVKLVH
jgi:hypothetical protein